MKNNKKYNANKGITLVALVITIIVLFILASVVINLAVDSNGLFSKANEAVRKWNEAVAEEDKAMQNILEQMNEINGETTKQASISLNKTTLALEIVDGVNAEETLVATKENLTGTVTWTSSVPTVATVDSNGKVTTVGEGETIITASCNGYSANCIVTVENLMSFTIEGIKYLAKPRMIWARWLESKYNTGGFTTVAPEGVERHPIGLVWSPDGYVIFGLMYHPNPSVGLTTSQVNYEDEIYAYDYTLDGQFIGE